MPEHYFDDVSNLLARCRGRWPPAYDMTDALWTVTMSVLLPQPAVLFALFQAEAGTVAGAREAFQMLITDLVGVRYPAANEVAGPGGGDWGIDTYVGRLDDSVVVWQSKFFPTWAGNDQQQQVRDSFKQLMTKAKSEGLPR
ncbi:hypothetical protein G7043_47160 [Lentzea sp. NEAU-D13]|uniref:Restriction endonuclease n=2 Tax=Lentzea alba TaxID=2714351 RepID=A0A7C9S0K2_9PSEU|nr:hypothetical protein [Lentzea alba]